MSETRRSLSTFQLHLVMTLATVTLAFCLVIGLSIFVPLAMQLSRPELDSQVLGGIGRHALDMHATFWPVVLVSMGGSTAAALILYRRMTSPLVRFHRVFDAVARGEQPQPLSIRQTDYLSIEEEAVNRMLAALAARVAERERAVERLLQIADDLPATASFDSESTQLLRELCDLAKALR